MAAIFNFTEDQQREYDAWLAQSSAEIRPLIERYPPYLLYRHKGTGQRMCILSYDGDGTLTVSVSAKYNRCVFEKNVFGVNPADLEECELPGPDEHVGAVLTEQKDVDAFIDAARPHVLALRKQQEGI